MKPFQAAVQLYKAWRATRPPEEVFPIDCRAIAVELGIKVHGDDLGDDFEAGLFIQPGLTAIVYNEKIREDGRKNFSIGHELGHFSLHKDRKEIRCSLADLTDIQPHPQNIEQEANQFAAHLLMPADDFRRQTDRKPPVLRTITALKGRYATTITATAIRFLELSRKPLAVIRVSGGRISGWSKNEAMYKTGLWLERGQAVPEDVLIDTLDGLPVDSRLWLNETHANLWEILQSAMIMPYYNLILLAAESREWEDDDSDRPPEATGELPWR